jgi:hypothetical protein
MSRIPDDRFRIFVSHKSSDIHLANDVAEAIEKLSPQFECWVDAQDIAAGSDWSRSILKALGQSHLLLLLFTVPDHKWDWCLYEAGLFIQFSNAADEDVRSVVSIFDPQSGPPRPLAGVQGAPAQPEGLAKFLSRLCNKPWEISDDWRKGPIVPKVKPAAIETAAQAIATSFHARLLATGEGSSDIRYLCHRIVLDAGIDQGEINGIPEDATIVMGPGATTSFTLSLFGVVMGEGSPTWGHLIQRLDAADAGWRRELDEAFVAAHREELWAPRYEAFRPWDHGGDSDRVYHPVLYSVTHEQVGGEGRAQIVIVLDPLQADAPAVTD